MFQLSEHHHHNHGEDGRSVMKKYDIKDMIVREDIMAKAKELADLLTTSDEVQTYRKAESLIASHTEVQDIIKQIKKKQKEIVGFEYFKNEKMVQKIELEIAELEEKLNGYPVVNEFKQTQEDINYLLQLVIGIVRDTVSDKIAVESVTSTTSPSSCSD